MNADGSARDGDYVRYFEDPRVVLGRCESAKRVQSTDASGNRQLLLRVSGPTLSANHSSFRYAANTYVEDLNAQHADRLPKYVLRTNRCVKAGEQARYDYSVSYTGAGSLSRNPVGDCMACGEVTAAEGQKHSELVLVCSCEAECHLSCLNPPLLEAPSNDWHCSYCVVRRPGVHGDTARRWKQGEGQTRICLRTVFGT